MSLSAISRKKLRRKNACGTGEFLTSMGYSRTMKVNGKKSLTKLPFRLRPGDHVHLKPFRDGKNSIPAQCGEYLGSDVKGIATVCLCDQHRDGRYDDGLRELTYDQLARKSG